LANQNSLLIEDSNAIQTAIERCIQCGICSASCPLSQYMDYTPRKIVTLIREDLVHEALKTKTIWLCTTCYLCAVRCPAKINIGEFMTALKSFALKNGYSNNLLYPKLIKTYTEFIDKYGRISEPRLIIAFSLKNDLLKLLRMLPHSIKLLKDGTLSLSIEKIQNLDEIKT